MIPLVDATDVSRVTRKLYRVGDVPLPFPVAGLQAVAFLVVAIVTWRTLGLFGVGFSAASSFYFVAPPLAAGWAAGGDQIEGGSVWSYLLSVTRWNLAPRVVHGGRRR